MRLIYIFGIIIMTYSFDAISADNSVKIAIIKADDVRSGTSKWKRFFSLSRGKGVKVSAGIICNSLQNDKKGYFKWLQELQKSGWVEFWNHGWDHKKWENEKKDKIYEFCNSGYDHQKKHFSDSQKIMKEVLGIAPVAFGTPYNKCDSVTLKVMNEDKDLKLFFGYRGKKLENQILAPMLLRGEHDGTGKPNVEKFKADYNRKKNLMFTSIQFHPNGFSEKQFEEYEKILEFLKKEGWKFMLPAEYLAMKKNIQ